MKRGRSQDGFTIVEVLVFLAVSGALLFASLTLITTTQRGTEFNQAANDVAQQINGVISNVATGYYAGNDNLDCADPGGPRLRIGPGTQERGTSTVCEFIGRAIEFEDPEYFTIYDVAGARKNSTGGDVQSMAQAKPTVISQTAQKVYYRNGLRFPSNGLRNPLTPVRGVGFFSSFAKASTIAADELDSSNLQYDFVYLSGADMTGAVSDLVRRFESQKPADGMKLCLNSGAGNEKAIITIGGDQGRAASTELTISGGQCP